MIASNKCHLGAGLHARSSRKSPRREEPDARNLRRKGLKRLDSRPEMVVPGRLDPTRSGMWQVAGSRVRPMRRDWGLARDEGQFSGAQARERIGLRPKLRAARDGANWRATLRPGRATAADEARSALARRSSSPSARRGGDGRDIAVPRARARRRRPSPAAASHARNSASNAAANRSRQSTATRPVNAPFVLTTTSLRSARQTTPHSPTTSPRMS